MKARDILAGGGFFVFGLAMVFLTGQLPERSLPNTPGPSFFPWILTGAILVLSGLLAAQAFLAPAPDASAKMPIGGARPMWTLLAVFALYLALLPSLGFVVATIPFFAALMVLYGEKRPIPVAFGSIAATVIIYAIFRHGFRIILPRGILDGVIA